MGMLNESRGHVIQPGIPMKYLVGKESGLCRIARCPRCGAPIAHVCTDEGLPNARLRHTLDRWVGEMARSSRTCPRCCAVAARRHGSW